MTPSDKLRAMVEVATPGPWGWPHDNALAGDYYSDREGGWSLVAAIHDAGLVQAADAAIIALAPEAVTLLADMGDEIDAWRRYAEKNHMGAAKTNAALLTRLQELTERGDDATS